MRDSCSERRCETKRKNKENLRKEKEKDNKLLRKRCEKLKRGTRENLHNFSLYEESKKRRSKINRILNILRLILTRTKQ